MISSVSRRRHQNGFGSRTLHWASARSTGLREKHRGLIVEEFGNVAGNGLKVLERLFHDKLLKNIPSGYTMSKAADIESYRNGDFNLRKVESSKYQINIKRFNIFCLCITPTFAIVFFLVFLAST